MAAALGCGATVNKAGGESRSAASGVELTRTAQRTAGV